ncbi:MAG: DUF1127 domain-containing protein [Fulvimarina manganoxydans]|uniref:DUF1127 domain-containing protein n=1 Tax=Fulvimarina manganoxydans TaxID=937218 RepID=UPI002356321F|nr:DUF1127 domain-containing protein [Fulvimarina manganoxydans]MCK5933118.1 DUF1127 domain-containing protein [Fulvimarina manganoxydans]
MQALLLKPTTDLDLRFGILATLRVGMRAMRDHRRARRNWVYLSRMPPRLLRDMGLEPEEIYQKLDGTFDEVGPVHLSPAAREPCRS